MEAEFLRIKSPCDDCSINKDTCPEDCTEFNDYIDFINGYDRECNHGSERE